LKLIKKFQQLIVDIDGPIEPPFSFLKFCFCLSKKVHIFIFIYCGKYREKISAIWNSLNRPICKIYIEIVVLFKPVPKNFNFQPPNPRRRHEMLYLRIEEESLSSFEHLDDVGPGDLGFGGKEIVY
jgi:hypothetical protein